MEPDSMPPKEDAGAILRLALRHEQSLAASLDPAFAQENWGFLGRACRVGQAPRVRSAGPGP
jgi:hypothetical protein